MSEPDRIALGLIDTRARLIGHGGDAGPVERRLDAVARHALPGALAAALLPRTNGIEGLIRIDTIELDLTVTRDALDTGEIAHRWAARLSEALAIRLRTPGSNGIAWFASHAEFAAAYLEHRFGVAPHASFAFAEFEPLEHVTPAEAAVELLSARPEFVATLARLGARRGRPEWLAERLSPAQAAELLERLLGEAAADTADAGRLLPAILAAAPPGWRALEPARAALTLALAALDASAAEPPATLEVVAVARTVAAIAAVAAQAPEIAETLGSASLRPLASSGTVPPSLAPELAWLDALEQESQGRRTITAVIEALLPRARASATNDALKPGHRQSEIPPFPMLDSPFAGLVLLLPVWRDLALAPLLTPAQQRELLVAALAPPHELIPAGDALAAFLVPERERGPPARWPPLPDASDLDPSAEAHARRLLASFAARLPGLEASSPAYLRRQFLYVAGTLTLTPKVLEVRLQRPPLAIVLTMCGMIGERGPLPLLDGRLLRIALA